MPSTRKKRKSSNNPLTGQPYSKGWEKIQEAIKNIPANQTRVRKELGELLEKSDVILVNGATGSGKSVILPGIILDNLGANSKVVCTQPRTTNTRGVAEFAAKVLDVKLGEEIGYKYRFNDMTSEKTRLTYMTDGLMSNRLLNNPLFPSLDCLIVDEVHERNANMDIIIVFIKRYLEEHQKERPKKFVLMSATFDSSKYKAYFKAKGVKVAELEIEGIAHAVEVIYLKNEEEAKKWKDSIKGTVADILTSKELPRGDILVFLPSVADIDELCRYFNSDNEFKIKTKLNLVALPLHSNMSEEAKELAIDPKAYHKLEGKPGIKIVCSTNIAESGVTIDGILYVVDSCRKFAVRFDPKIRSWLMNKEFIAKDSADQRKGRAGRTAAGYCYRMATEEDFNRFREESWAEIEEGCLDGILLDLLDAPLTNSTNKTREFLKDLMNPPPKTFIDSSLAYLEEIGMIKDGKITSLGKCCASLALDPGLALALLAAQVWGVFEDALIVVSMLAEDDNIIKWLVPPSKEKTRELLNFRQSLINAWGDPHMLLKLWKHKDSPFVNRRKMQRVPKLARVIRETFNKLEENCKEEVPKKDFSNLLPEDKISLVFIWAFRNQIAVKKGILWETPHGEKIGFDRAKIFIRQPRERVAYFRMNIIKGTKILSGLVNITDDLWKLIA